MVDRQASLGWTDRHRSVNGCNVKVGGEAWKTHWQDIVAGFRRGLKGRTEMAERQVRIGNDGGDSPE